MIGTPGFAYDTQEAGTVTVADEQATEKAIMAALDVQDHDSRK